MLGPVVNAVAIVVCAVVGKYFIKDLPERFENIVVRAIGIALIYLGISGASENQRVLILILSMVIGAVLGEMLDIDKGMNKLGTLLEKKLGFGEGNFSKGFVAASLLFCTGSMAIVGSLESGLMGNHEMLYAKSILDGVLAIVFASQMGIGVLFAAIPVLLYEGVIALGAGFLREWLTPEIITEMSATGSLLIALLGFNMMEIKPVKVANLIPAIFMPWIFISIETAVSGII